MRRQKLKNMERNCVAVYEVETTSWKSGMSNYINRTARLDNNPSVANEAAF